MRILEIETKEVRWVKYTRIIEVDQDCETVAEAYELFQDGLFTEQSLGDEEVINCEVISNTLPGEQ